jgi:Stealth protein CR2, conserved region 2/Stealth protein CR1, conserved region 1/Stealth protein CR3, conserved region 3
MAKLVQLFFFFLFSFCNMASLKAHYLLPLKKDKGPIDIVYTWVNGQESPWQQKRDKAMREYTAPATCEAKVKSRFRNRDELKYSLRSIYHYAKFVNHIYIVTDAQRPSWLKNHPKITVVDHKHIFSNHGHLPTFNSHAIEANLHKIPGLSERFIYFNDDVFLGKPIKAKRFFSKNGKIKIFLSESVAARGIYSPRNIGFVAGWKNTNQLLDNIFINKKRKKRYYLNHAPFAFRKSQIRQFETLLPDVVQRNSSHKFRSPEDFAFTNGLIQYFALYQGQARKARFKSMVVYFGNDLNRNEFLLNRLKKKKPSAFCLEDVANVDNAAADKQLNEFMEGCFPEKAPWEQ